ncbi:glutamate--cysteine ligase [Kribbella sp. NPDC051587]|uniref:glutamate--cysteine ligase n=1 Tax=Kribbella sp. NPDC051587 TaxID=3364119 RepID=UPI0037A1A8C2
MKHPSIGVEEELLLVSATGDPLPRSQAVVDELPDLDVTLELTRAQVELNSPVCDSATELHRHLTSMRAELAAAAHGEGARLLAIAVPPAGEAAQLVTRKPRYREMAERYGLLAREQGVCGCHVHVDVPDLESALRVSNYLRPWLPSLLALTSNSPVYLGQDTGFASWRWLMWSRWPSAGPPPYLESVDHYEALIAMHIATGTVMDEQMIYWDVRPSSHLPTIEVRVSDVPMTVDETVLHATLSRALVMTALADGGQGPTVQPEILRAGYWLAARDGLTGGSVDVATGELLPVAELLTKLTQYVGPALQELGDEDLVTEGIERALSEGNGAMRQQQMFRGGGDVVALTEITG